jgi:hypothetical protein
MTNRWKVIGASVAILVVFLVGFLPQVLEKRHLQNELENTRSQLSVAQLQNEIDEARNLAGRMLLEASRQNYGTAGEHSTKLFNQLRDLANHTGNATLKTSIAELLDARDSITSGLAQGNSSIIPELQSLLQRMYNLPDAESVIR